MTVTTLLAFSLHAELARRGITWLSLSDCEAMVAGMLERMSGAIEAGERAKGTEVAPT